jgi:hypothetical protein
MLQNGFAHRGACGNPTGTFTMEKKPFYLGDILNVCFQEEYFWDDEKSIGSEALIMFMLGADSDSFEQDFQNDQYAVMVIDMCADSLLKQFDFLLMRRFKNDICALRKMVKNSVVDEALEMEWLARQTQRYGEMLEVISIGYLFLPRDQDRFEKSPKTVLFTDRPLNTN